MKVEGPLMVAYHFKLTWNDSEDLSSESTEGVWDSLADDSSERTLLERRDLVDDNAVDFSEFSKVLTHFESKRSEENNDKLRFRKKHRLDVRLGNKFGKIILFSIFWRETDCVGESLNNLQTHSDKLEDFLEIWTWLTKDEQRYYRLYFQFTRNFWENSQLPVEVLVSFSFVKF